MIERERSICFSSLPFVIRQSIDIITTTFTFFDFVILFVEVVVVVVLVSAYIAKG